MILHLLQQDGIDGRVEGEYLQGALGELPASGLIRVVVPADQAERATALIREWEKASPPPTPVASAKPVHRPAVFLLAGLLVGGGGVFSFYNGPITDDGADYNGDGVLDERSYFNGSRVTRIESDRNFDGKPDVIRDYDATGVVERSSSDDDFNGQFEGRSRFRNGQPDSSEVDRDGDGKLDYRAEFVYGVLTIERYFNPLSGAQVKQVRWSGGRPVEASIDRDGDGTHELYAYDQYGDLAGNLNMKSSGQPGK